MSEHGSRRGDFADAASRPRRAWIAASLALVFVVVFASALIRLAGDELGAALPFVRGVHRFAASAAAIAILVAGWYGWRTGERATSALVVALMLALSALGALTGTEPPPLAAAGNLLGGLMLASLLAWWLGRGGRRGGAPLAHAAAALAAAQVLLGAWCTIFEKGETWTFALLVHMALGLAAAVVLGLVALRIRAWPLLAAAVAAPVAGLVSALMNAPAAVALTHAAAAALVVAGAAWAHGRLT
ncbi:MAG: hypothetical protein AB7O31_10730 [Burkholderiales bacterium]